LVKLNDVKDENTVRGDGHCFYIDRHLCYQLSTRQTLRIERYTNRVLPDAVETKTVKVISGMVEVGVSPVVATW